MQLADSELRRLARTFRERHAITGVRVTLRGMTRVLQAEGVDILRWPLRDDLPGDPRLRQILGAYMDEPPGPAIMLDRYLRPRERRVFTLAHELKHHACDRGVKLDYCSRTPGDDPIELGADTFASEFLFPDEEFFEWMERLGIGPRECTREGLLLLKQTTRTTLSLAGLSKRADRLGFAAPVCSKLSGTTWVSADSFARQRTFGSCCNTNSPRYSPSHPRASAVGEHRAMSHADVDAYFSEVVVWMKNDVRREIQLAQASMTGEGRAALSALGIRPGGGNLLGALGLVAYTDALGLLRVWNRSRTRGITPDEGFLSFFDAMAGGRYGDWRRTWEAAHAGMPIYDVLRSGLVHEYRPKVDSEFWIADSNDELGVDDVGGHLIFKVAPYHRHFCDEADRLHAELRAHPNPEIPPPLIKPPRSGGQGFTPPAGGSTHTRSSPVLPTTRPTS